MFKSLGLLSSFDCPTTFGPNSDSRIDCSSIRTQCPFNHHSNKPSASTSNPLPLNLPNTVKDKSTPSSNQQVGLQLSLPHSPPAIETTPILKKARNSYSSGGGSGSIGGNGIGQQRMNSEASGSAAGSDGWTTVVSY